MRDNFYILLKKSDSIGIHSPLPQQPRSFSSSTPPNNNYTQYTLQCYLPIGMVERLKSEEWAHCKVTDATQVIDDGWQRWPSSIVNGWPISHQCHRCWQCANKMSCRKAETWRWIRARNGWQNRDSIVSLLLSFSDCGPIAPLSLSVFLGELLLLTR